MGSGLGRSFIETGIKEFWPGCQLNLLGKPQKWERDHAFAESLLGQLSSVRVGGVSIVQAEAGRRGRDFGPVSGCSWLEGVGPSGGFPIWVERKEKRLPLI